MIKNKSLVLHPADCNEKPAAQDLTDALQQLKFIGSPLDRENGDEDNGRYLVGDDFLQLIIFLGCSPSVELAPNTEDKPFCHVSFIQTQPQMVTSTHTRNPRCPLCRKDAASIVDFVAVWGTNDSSHWECVNCNEASDLEDLDWRHTAGAASFFIEVSNIFPDEAVPSDELMSTLQKVTNSEWRYFYYHD